MNVFDLLKLLFRAGKYRWMEDPQELQYLQSKIKKGEVVMDIGAHKGAYSFWMQKAVGQKGKIILFEPQEKGYLLLKKIFTQPNVMIENAAVSDSLATRQLYILPQNNEVSYEASLENKYENAFVQQVRTTTIDLYCKKENIAPTFIKIDVEGHERQVLEGGYHTLKSFHPALLVEAEVRHIGLEGLFSVFRLLQGIGYKGYFFYNKKQLPLSEFDPGVHQLVSNISKRAYVNNFVFE